MSAFQFTPTAALRSTYGLQRRGGWRSSIMIERYTHLAPDHLAQAADRRDPLLAGYDLATLEK